MSSPRPLAALAIGLCLLLSGAAGLIYEVVWMRLLGLLFGHTVLAVTTVLVAFMAGLAGGAWALGRRVDHARRPLATYALLEMGIALTAAALSVVLGGMEAVYVALTHRLGLSGGLLTATEFGLATVAMLPPTLLMGATLPVVARAFVVREGGLGRTVGHLYALNTLGAVSGTAAAGFALLPALGVRNSVAAAVAANLAAGIIALITDRWLRSDEAGIRPGPPPETRREAAAGPGLVSRGVARLALGAIAVSGGAAMVYEIAWTRALSLVVGSSVYAFSAMLTTFLVGLAAGSALYAWLAGRRSGQVQAQLLGWLQAAVAVTALGLAPAFQWLPDLVLALARWTGVSAHGAFLAQFGLSALVMLPPALLLGAAFPCAVAIWTRGVASLGRDVGCVYAANTLGTIVGAVAAGFLLLPSLGAQASIATAAAANAVVAVVLIGARGGSGSAWRRSAAVGLAVGFAGGVWLVPRWDPRVMAGGVSIYLTRFAFASDPAGLFRDVAASRRLLFYREGLNATVAVERSAQMTSLRVNGKVDASNGADMPTQYLLGHLPLLLHPQPERVLIIGLGSGVTAGAVSQHPDVREIHVAELEPAVVEASAFFAVENRRVLTDPRVRLLMGDARHTLLAGHGRYDVISSEPSNPWMAGVASLFTREFYQLARRRLAEGGMMVQWVQGYNLFPRDLRTIVGTFRGVFPHTTLWRTLRGDYLLVGTSTALSVDYARLVARLAAAPGARQDLARLKLDSPVDLLSLFLLGEDDLVRFSQGAPEHTDDRPILEFSAPRALYTDTTDENARILRAARTAALPAVAGLPSGVLESRRLHFARAHWASGEREEALDELRRAQPSGPGDQAFVLERAKLLFVLGETASALDELTRLPRHYGEPRLVASYLRAGAILRELNMGELVLQHGRTRFGERNPAEAYNNLGVFYTQMGIRFGEPALFDLAVESLEAARRLEPQSHPLINNLGNAYFELGRLAEAQDAYQQVVALAPREAEAHFNLGLVHERAGRLDAAVRAFETAISLRPAWPLPRARLVELRHQKGSDKR